MRINYSENPFPEIQGVDLLLKSNDNSKLKLKIVFQKKANSF